MTMLISILTHSTIAAFIIPVVLMRGFTGYLHFPDSRAADYLPTHIIGWSGLQNWHLVNLFGIQMNLPQFAPLLYGIMAVSLALLCGLGWKHDTVMNY